MEPVHSSSLRGMQKVMDRHEISVVVNTAEDIWISGNHISPDVDTVMYLFAGVLNTRYLVGDKERHLHHSR